MNLHSTTILIAIALVISIGCKSDTTAQSSTSPATTTANTGNSASPAAAPTQTANKMVGQWTIDSPEMKAMTFEVKPDSSFTLSGPGDFSGIKLNVEMTGTIKTEGDKATLHMASMKFSAPEGADKKTAAIAEEANKKTTEQVKTMKDQTGIVAWKDDDTFTVTDTDPASKNKVETYHRKK